MTTLDIQPPTYRANGATLYEGDFLEASRDWPAPTVIVSDGPYGVGSFPGDLNSHRRPLANGPPCAPGSTAT